METPRTKAGTVTEKIMEIFSGFERRPVVFTDTAQYNAIYSHVLKTLEKEYQ